MVEECIRNREKIASTINAITPDPRTVFATPAYFATVPISKLPKGIIPK